MAENSNCKRKRSAKITTGQYQIYLEELQNNEAFRTNKFNPKNPDVLDETWEALVIKLNAAGGPIKTVQQWKERIADWKCNVRKKARKLQVCRVKTGGGPPEIPLTELENRLLDLTGRTVIKGLDEVPELGLPTNDPPAPVRPPTPQLATTSVTPQPTIEQPSSQCSSQTKLPKRVTLAASVRALVASDSTSTNLLEINASLKTLVKLKQKSLLLKELQLKLQYPDTDFQFLDEDSD